MAWRRPIGPSRIARGARASGAAASFLGNPPENFFAMNRDRTRRGDSKPHVRAAHLEHREGDVLSDPHVLAITSSQDQHLGTAVMASPPSVAVI